MTFFLLLIRFLIFAFFLTFIIHHPSVMQGFSWAEIYFGRFVQAAPILFEQVVSTNCFVLYKYKKFKKKKKIKKKYIYIYIFGYQKKTKKKQKQKHLLILLSGKNLGLRQFHLVRIFLFG